MASKAAQQNVTFIYEGVDRKGSKVKGEATGKAPSIVKAELRKQGITAKKVVRKREITFGGKKKNQAHGHRDLYATNGDYDEGRRAACSSF